MSEPVTALGGLAFEAGIARIEEMPLQGMITLRGDLSQAEVRSAAQGAAAVNMPGQGEVICANGRGICWMSPDELLVLCPYQTVAKTLEAMQTALGDAHALVVDVSDARASFVVSGAQARPVLAKLAPVDLAPGRFEAPMFRRTRLAQVPAALWMTGTDAFRIVCFRSQARYVFDLLSVAAQPGSEVAAC